VSHELRTPLTVIQGYLESFQIHHPDLDGDIQKAHVRMLAQTQRMTNLVQDLLMLSRMEESIDRSKFVRNQMAPLLTLAVTKGQALAQKLDKQISINVALESQEDVVGIKAEIVTLLTHLVTNAVKYTQHGGQIDVTWHAVDHGLCVAVADNGIGIGQQHVSRLTERFYRVDPSRSSASGGTGLGLAIVKRIMLRHKGRLDISSKEGDGSCFTCIFPR
jgi:two-component system phosphate regulon sensor histidine kinase PhoR